MASPIAASSTAPMSVEYFGSPPEPLFNEPKNCLSPELLKDTVKLLFHKNELATGQSHLGRSVGEMVGYFKDSNTVLFLFELCRHLGLTPDVQYRAAELFHRFMIGHVEELYTHVINSAKLASPIAWNDVEERLKHQVILRAVSCVQLASKLSSHYHLVTLSSARRFLSHCGFRYATSSIVQSEVRVLKTIQFRVHHSTPLEFIEAMLCVFVQKDRGFPSKQLHGVALKLLDIYYLSRHQIVSTLERMMATVDSHDESWTLIDTVDVNYMFLAGAIITAAGFVVNQEVDMKVLLTSLSEITNITSKYILQFATVLLRELFILRKIRH